MEQVSFKKRNFSEVLVLVLGELKVQVVWKGRRWMAVEADAETKPKKKSLRLGSHFLFLWLFTSVNLKVLFLRCFLIPLVYSYFCILFPLLTLHSLSEIFIYYTIVDLQHYISFKYTAK